MYYDKRIRYLSYYESDIKLQNAGYVKFQVRDSLCQMVVYVKGPRLMGSGEAFVYLLSQDPAQGKTQKHLLGNLTIYNGQGHCAVRLNAENMADSGRRYDDICGIRIKLHEYRYLESRWSVVNTMPGRQGTPERESAESGLFEAQEEAAEVDLIVTPVSENVTVEKLPKENFGEEELIEEKRSEGIAIEKIWKTDFMEKAAESEAYAAQVAEDEEKSIQERLEEKIREEPQEEEADKWEQLKKTYPIVHPIREDEEYLKIEPKDFVIFTEKYQELIHNSFLLHGYYNYKHLIFGRKEKEDKTFYYLGVPGTFHDREKTVALMFGFEAFDGKREPAKNGDFGYYLRRVEI